VHFAALIEFARATLFITRLSVEGGSSSPRPRQNAEMRFHFLRRFLSVFLLLVALACVAQASSLRTKRFIFNDIGNTLNNFGATIKDTVKSIFQTITTTSQPEEIETQTTDPYQRANVTLEPRTIISVPLRCPANQIVVRGRCRIVTRRR